MVYNLSHNPQSYVNGYISMMRNMILTSSVGLGAMSFSNSFKKYEKIVKILAFIIFTYSIVYGIKAAIDFNEYINYMEKRNDIEDPYKFQLKQWKQWVILTYVYISIVTMICLLILFRKLI